MGDPKLQIDKRCDQIEKAILALASSLNVAESIEKILQGEESNVAGGIGSSP